MPPVTLSPYPVRSAANSRAARTVLNALGRHPVAAGKQQALLVCGGASIAGVLTRLVTPLAALAQAPLIMPCDERCLPDHHPERNDSALRQMVSDSLTITPLWDEAQQAATAESHHIDWESSVAVVSMADDGHIASLFPQRSHRQQDQDWIMVADAPRPPARRISLSADALHKVGHLVVLVFGANKIGPWQRALHNPQDDAILPVCHALQRPLPTAVVVCPQDA